MTILAIGTPNGGGIPGEGGMKPGGGIPYGGSPGVNDPVTGGTDAADMVLDEGGTLLDCSRTNTLEKCIQTQPKKPLVFTMALFWDFGEYWQ